MKEEIGLIGNYYGGLVIKESDSKYWWGIENFDGIGWQEITKSLFDELKKFGDGPNNFIHD